MRVQRLRLRLPATQQREAAHGKDSRVDLHEDKEQRAEEGQQGVGKPPVDDNRLLDPHVQSSPRAHDRLLPAAPDARHGLLDFARDGHVPQ